MVDTSGTAWGKNSQDAIEGQHIPVSRITLADLRDSDIDWRTYSLGSRQAPTTRERKVPRDHQVRARSAVMAGFDTSDRGQLIMACGTGKTFTSLIIAREFMEREGGSARILFAVPSLALLKQTLDDWSVEVDSAFTAWAVCSDTKVSARSDAPADSTVDLPIPATTDAQRLADSLGANNATEGLQVVFATYQSIEVIHRAQEIAGDEWRDFDLIICDEAHRTTGAAASGSHAYTSEHARIRTPGLAEILRPSAHMISSSVMQSDSFSQLSTIRNIANVLAKTDWPGLSGSQIDELLHDIGAPPRVAGNKREGLFGALTKGVSLAQAGERTREFIAAAMSPARYTTDRQHWDDLRCLLNQVLATEGWHIDDAGGLTQLAEAARTFDDIERLTSSLMEELQRRGSHERLMEYCSQELIAKSLFHAISEAAKSIPERIRILTGFTGDGQELFDAALGTNSSAPQLVINSFSTESEKSEHKGFKNLLIGIHGHYRNPRAHKTRLGSEESEHDFLDAFSLFSYVHRRLDSAQLYQSSR